MTRKSSPLLLIAILIVICLVVGYLSGMKTVGAINGWYATLQKPWFNPPNRIFGPVWTFLYILMGISGGLVVHKARGTRKIRPVLILFFGQLLLNAAWSFLFFGWKQIGLALAEMLVLWGMILACILYFRRIRPIAAWLLVPYLLWVSFATILTLSILVLNP